MTSSLPQQILDNCVYRKHVKDRGNGLFATRDLSPKSQVLFIARPLLDALETSKLSFHCYYCHKSADDPINTLDVERGQGLKTCSGCKAVKFCGKKCQTRAWSEFHRLECKLFGRLHPRILPTAVRAIIRALKQHKAGLISDSEWHDLLALESHRSEIQDAGDERMQDVFVMMKGIKGYCGTEHSEEMILNLACIVLVNSFTFTTPAFDSLGMALHPKSALLNHACDPNAFVRFDVAPSTDAENLPAYGSISVHALRPISKDEEITISYVDTTFPFDKRQEELKRRYFFDCACSMCSRGPVDVFHQTVDLAAVTGNDRLAIVNSRTVAEQTLEIARSGSDDDLDNQIANIKSAMKAQAATNDWPLHRYPWPQLRHELLLKLLVSQRFFEAALQSATLVRVIYPVLYTQEHHPLRVTQVWELATLCRHCLGVLVSGEKTQEEMPVKCDISTMGNLWCVLAMETQRILNTNVKMQGLLERKVDGTVDEMKPQLGPTWAAYERDSDAARGAAFAWLDGQVKSLLKKEDVSDNVVELSFSLRDA